MDFDTVLFFHVLLTVRPNIMIVFFINLIHKFFILIHLLYASTCFETASCKMDTGSFPGVKCGRGVLLTTHPLLVPWSWKSRAIPLPTLWASPGQ